MRYLLIDFGASNIKSIIYDTINKTFSHQKNIESPFRKVNNISKKDLKILLSKIISYYTSIQIDNIIIKLYLYY
jgi:hypothetical protein